MKKLKPIKQFTQNVDLAYYKSKIMFSEVKVKQIN